jgi:hypothetical protein
LERIICVFASIKLVGKTPLTVAFVPQKIKAGVCNSPWSVLRLPSLAFELRS